MDCSDEVVGLAAAGHVTTIRHMTVEGGVPMVVCSGVVAFSSDIDVGDVHRWVGLKVELTDGDQNPYGAATVLEAERGDFGVGFRVEVSEQSPEMRVAVERAMARLCFDAAH